MRSGDFDSAIRVRSLFFNTYVEDTVITNMLEGSKI
jgi:hypothetical protein